MNKANARWAMLVLMITSTKLVATPASEPRLGINVGSIHQLASSLPFTDLFKVFSPWHPSCDFEWQHNIPLDPGCTRKNSFNTQEYDLLKLDSHGWVRSLPDRKAPEIYTSVVSGLHLHDDFPLGRYVLLYAGEGEIEVQGALNIIHQKAGRIEFNLIARQRGIKVKITKTRKRNYIRDIHLVAAANENSFPQQPFDANYIARLHPFESIRFMSWMHPRMTNLERWKQRPTPKYAHYTGPAGVPIETMLDLANHLDAAPWVNIPHSANDDFIRNYARLAKRRITNSKKVYVEFSNEIWNAVFPATTYAIHQAQKLWPDAYEKESRYKRRTKLASNWYGKRSVEMCQIWKQVFAKQKHRVNCVIASQSHENWVGKEALDCPLWRGGPCGLKVDSYAVDPFFGDYIAKLEHRTTVNKWVNKADGLNHLFKEILQGGALIKGPKDGAIQHFIDSTMRASMQLADEYGLPLLAYESGQHLIRYDQPHRSSDPKLLSFFMQANQDPRMQQAYQRYLQAWEENGGKMMMHYYGIGESTPGDFFGMLPSSQTPSSPKYMAMLRHLKRRYEDTYQHSKPLSRHELQNRRSSGKNTINR